MILNLPAYIMEAEEKGDIRSIEMGDIYISDWYLIQDITIRYTEHPYGLQEEYFTLKLAEIRTSPWQN